MLPFIGKPKIKILFIPTLRCNYSCPYCIIKTKMRFDKIYPREQEKSWPDWIKALEDFPPATIHISGGEPLLYEDLISLLNNLPGKHRLQSLTTSLCVCADGLCNVRNKNFDIAASFHPGTADIDSFKSALSKIKNCGFRISVNLMAYPAILEFLPQLKEQFRKEVGLETYVCVYEEAISKIYKYNPKQMQLVEPYIGSPLRLFSRFDNTRPKTCVGGSRYFIILPNADVYTCHAAFYLQKPEFYLGNLFKGTFAPLKTQNNCSLPCICSCDVHLAAPRIRKSGLK